MYEILSPFTNQDSQMSLTSDMPMLINGWGFKAQAMSAFVQRIGIPICVVDQPANETNYFDWLDQLQCLADGRKLIGWSLGVQTIYRMITSGISVQSAVLINGKPDFLVEEGVGLSSRDFNRFRKRVSCQPEVARKYFAALCANGGYNKPHLSFVKDQLNHFSQSLERLGDEDVSISHLDQVLYLAGANDALISTQVTNDYLKSETLKSGAHDLPISHANWVASKVANFWGLKSTQQRISTSFSQRASSYDSHAQLQRRIADRLLTTIPQVQAQDEVVLDLGSGTGYLMQKLGIDRRDFIALDLSLDMLRESNVRNIRGYVCADAQLLPFADHSFDRIVSSLSVQWCDHRQQLFAELYRTLKPQGEIHLNTLTSGTLSELNDASIRAGLGARVNHFESYLEWFNAAISAGFVVKIERFKERVTADNFNALLKHLRAIGANCKLGGAKKSLNRQELVKWANELERESSYVTNYHVLQMTLTK